MTPKGIVFDKDGVLVDFQKTYAPSTLEVLRALADNDPGLMDELANAVKFDIQAVAFHPGSVVIAGTAEDIAKTWHPFLQRFSLGELIGEVENLYDDLTVRNVTAFDDVDSTLSALASAGIMLGLATNDTRESAYRHLDAIGQTHRFHFISGYDSGHGAKPGPGMIEAFARSIGVRTSEVMMIGDSLHDMQAGRNAGAVCVAVTTGLADNETLAPAADHVIARLSALPELALGTQK